MNRARGVTVAEVFKEQGEVVYRVVIWWEDDIVHLFKVFYLIGRNRLDELNDLTNFLDEF